MRIWAGVGVLGLGLILLGYAAAGAGRNTALSPRRGDSQRESQVVACAFSNPGYAGFCREKTTASKVSKPEAACKPILDCLNDARCVKTYCDGTNIRSGWKLESATVEGNEQRRARPR
jgi:hypothetical protein